MTRALYENRGVDIDSRLINEDLSFDRIACLRGFTIPQKNLSSLYRIQCAALRTVRETRQDVGWFEGLQLPQELSVAVIFVCMRNVDVEVTIAAVAKHQRSKMRVVRVREPRMEEGSRSR